MVQLEIASPTPSYEPALQHRHPKTRPYAVVPVGPQPLAPLARPLGVPELLAAVGRLRAVDYGDNPETLDAS